MGNAAASREDASALRKEAKRRVREFLDRKTARAEPA